MAKQRLIYLDILKILAIILVIFNHSHWGIASSSALVNATHYLFFDFCKIAVPIFIMASGALLLKKEMTYKEIFTKRIFRVIVPLVVVSAIGAILYHGNFKTFILSIFFSEYSNLYWLWYLYLLIALYLITPFLQKMIKKMTNKDFIIFILIFVLGVSFLQEISFFIKVLFGENLNLKAGIFSGLFTVDVGLYVAGYYLSNLKIDKKIFNTSLIVLIISLIAGMFMLRYGIIQGLTYDSILHYGHFLVIVNALCVFIIAKYLFSDRIKNEKICKLITTISGSVFGVYLLHPFVLDYFNSMGWMQNLLRFNTFVGIVVLDLVTFIVLTVAIYLIRKIPLFRKFL